MTTLNEYFPSLNVELWVLKICKTLTITKDGFELLASAVKKSDASHHEYHLSKMTTKDY